MIAENMWVVGVLCAALLGLLSIRAKVRQLKILRLEEKFGSREVALRVFAGQVWQGMSSEMLRESRGKPDAVDSSVYKNKVKETWKYGQIGKNRYKLRLLIENDIVVGWR